MAVLGKVESWSGSVTLEPGCLMFSGIVGTTHQHAHAAVQLMVVTAGRVELEDRHGQRRAAQTVLIPTRAWHAIHGRGATAAFLYCDPEGALGRGLQDRVGGGGIDSTTGLPQQARRGWRGRRLHRARSASRRCRRWPSCPGGVRVVATRRCSPLSAVCSRC